MSERVRREVLLPASVQDVWDAVIGDGWLADEVRLDLRPGGEAYFGLPSGVKTGWIEEVVLPGAGVLPGESGPDAGAVLPGRGGPDRARLTFWWARDDEPASRVELTLEERHE